MSQRPADALTAAVGCAREDTTGSQPQEPPKPPKAKKPRKKKPAPPSPTEPSPPDTEDDFSGKEDTMGRRKKASITHILDEEEEEELAEWWRENPGLYDKSNETYRRKAKKDQLIVEEAARMGVQGSDAAMLAGWIKSMRTIYRKRRRR